MSYPNRLHTVACGCGVMKNDTVPKEETKPTEIPETKEPVTEFCLGLNVTAITQIDDKILIILDDCRYITASADVLKMETKTDTPAANEISAELSERLETIETKLDKLKMLDELIVVKDFNNEPQFKAFPLDNNE